MLFSEWAIREFFWRVGRGQPFCMSGVDLVPRAGSMLSFCEVVAEAVMILPPGQAVLAVAALSSMTEPVDAAALGQKPPRTQLQTTQAAVPCSRDEREQPAWRRPTAWRCPVAVEVPPPLCR